MAKGLARGSYPPLPLNESSARIRDEKSGMKAAASPQIYILQRSCYHNPESINLNPEPNLCFPTFAIWYNRFGPGQCLFTGQVNSISSEI